MSAIFVDICAVLFHVITTKWRHSVVVVNMLNFQHKKHGHVHTYIDFILTQIYSVALIGAHHYL